MRFLTVFLLGCLAMVHPVQAQELQTVGYGVRGYNIGEVGYPSDIVPGENGRFYYIEYFAPGNDPSRHGWYLQGFAPKLENGQESMDLQWVEPVARQEDGPFQWTGLHGMSGSMAVVGQRPNEKKSKQLDAAVQFFGYDGQRIGPVQTVTPFRTDLTDFQNQWHTSPDDNYLLWFASNPDEKAAKRQYYVAVYKSTDGRVLYRKELRFPPVMFPEDVDYRVTQVALDRRGNPFFLLKAEELVGNANDTLRKPVLIRYDYKNDEYEGFMMDFPGVRVPHLAFTIGENDNLLVLAALAADTGTGLRNGERLARQDAWTGFGARRYNLMRNMLLEVDTSYALPDSVLERYAENGANFSQSQIVVEGGKLIWLLEEAFTDQKPRGLQFLNYDLLLSGWHLSDMSLEWTNTVFKRQRAYGDNALQGYSLAKTELFLHIVFLTEQGANGKILNWQVNRETGGIVTKELISNEDGRFLYFGGRYAQVNKRLLMIGVGNPNKNDYYLLQIKPLP